MATDGSSFRMCVEETPHSVNDTGCDADIGIKNQQIWGRGCRKSLIHPTGKSEIRCIADEFRAITCCGGVFKGAVCGGIIHNHNFSNVRGLQNRCNTVLQPVSGIPVNDAYSDIHRRAILLPECGGPSCKNKSRFRPSYFRMILAYVGRIWVSCAV